MFDMTNSSCLYTVHVVFWLPFQITAGLNVLPIGAHARELILFIVTCFLKTNFY